MEHIALHQDIILIEHLDVEAILVGAHDKAVHHTVLMLTALVICPFLGHHVSRLIGRQEVATGHSLQRLILDPLGLPTVDSDRAGGYSVIVHTGQDFEGHIHNIGAIHIQLSSSLIGVGAEVVVFHTAVRHIHLHILQPVVAIVDAILIGGNEDNGVPLSQGLLFITHCDEQHVAVHTAVIMHRRLTATGQALNTDVIDKNAIFVIGQSLCKLGSIGQIDIVVKHPGGKAFLERRIGLPGQAGPLCRQQCQNITAALLRHGQSTESPSLCLLIDQVVADADGCQPVDDQGVHILVIEHTIRTLVIDEDLEAVAALLQRIHMEHRHRLLGHCVGLGACDLSAGHTLLSEGCDIQALHVPRHGHIVLLVVGLEDRSYSALTHCQLLQENRLIILGQTDDVDDHPVHSFGAVAVGINTERLHLHHVLHPFTEVDVTGRPAGGHMAVGVIVAAGNTRLAVRHGHIVGSTYDHAIDSQFRGKPCHGTHVDLIDLIAYHQIIEVLLLIEDRCQAQLHLFIVELTHVAGQRGINNIGQRPLIIHRLRAHPVDHDGVVLLVAVNCVGDLNLHHIIAHYQIVHQMHIGVVQLMVVHHHIMAAIPDQIAVAVKELIAGVHKDVGAGLTVRDLHVVVVEIGVEVGRHLIVRIALGIPHLDQSALTQIGVGRHLIGLIHMDHHHVLLGGDFVSGIVVLIQLVNPGDEHHLSRHTLIKTGHVVAYIGLGIEVLQFSGLKEFSILIPDLHCHGTSGRFLGPLCGRKPDLIGTELLQDTVVNIQEIVDPLAVPHRCNVAHRDIVTQFLIVHIVAHSNDISRIRGLAPVEFHDINVSGVHLGGDPIDILVLKGSHGNCRPVLALEQAERAVQIAAFSLIEIPAAHGTSPNGFNV